MLRAAAAGVFVSPRMSRDTAAVVHRRRPHLAGHKSHKGNVIRLPWRRLPETVPRSYNSVFASVSAATGSVVWACVPDGQTMAAMVRLVRIDIANTSGAILDRWPERNVC